MDKFSHNFFDVLQSWLSTRHEKSDEPDETNDLVTLATPESLKSMGVPDLVVEKFEMRHQDDIVYCLEGSSPTKRKPWTQLSHLVGWSAEFATILKKNKNTLATIELIRGAHEFPISVANFRVDEAAGIVTSALTFDLGLSLVHPDTRAANYAASNILIEDSASLHDIVRQVFACLYSRCVVRLAVRANNYFTALLAALLVDLMHQSGATKAEISCVCFDKRDSLGSERFIKPLTTNNKASKLSILAAVFRETDTFAAAQGIIESYFREQYPNLIVLVEEAAYSRFVKDWQRYYSHAVHIGSRMDERTTIVDQFNSKLSINLEAIDIKTVHKMPGNVINVLKFRNMADLSSLMANLRKVPYMTVWNDNLLLAQEFCLRNNICNDFWINHVPRALAERRFGQDLLQFYQESVTFDMVNIYNSVQAQFNDDMEHVRKMAQTFAKKDARLRQTILFKAYTSLLNKNKSFKNGSSTGEMVAKLRRFQKANGNLISNLSAGSGLDGSSRVDVQVRPVGLAIMFVREDSSLKSRQILVEFIFKNLLIGNAVLLVCPQNTLGVKFSLEYDHVIPFKMVNDALPDISRLSLDSTLDSNATMTQSGTGGNSDGSGSYQNRRQCPKNTYAIEILAEMTSESCEAITVALGCRQKSLWFANSDQSNYWSE